MKTNKTTAPAFSPVIKKEKKESATVSFGTALAATLEDKKIRSSAWPEGDYGSLIAGILHVFKSGESHKWIISDGDIMSGDWIIL